MVAVQGNAISNAVIMVEVNGHLEKLVKMEVHENNTPIIGHKGHSAHRLVLKTVKKSEFNFTTKTAILSAVVTLKNIWAQRLNSINKLKEILNNFSLIRIENSSLLGTPDLLVCNTSGHFCTVELKVTKGNKLRFSPHQIAFHKRHPTQYFYLSKGPWSFAP